MIRNAEFHRLQTGKINYALHEKDKKRRWYDLSAVGREIETALDDAGTGTGKGKVYCYVAHVANQILEQAQGHNTPEARQIRNDYRVLLFEFDTNYAR